MLTDVKSFLHGTKPAFGNSPKPRLYCSSKWWKQKQPGDQAQDASGVPVPNLTVRDKFQGQLGVIEGKQQYAYWSDDYNSYTLGDDTAGEFYCDDPRNTALTDDSEYIRPIALIMCPSSFSLHTGTDHERTPALGTIRPQDGKLLNTLQPRSLTLFHEVIHVVRGVRATTRLSGDPPEWYGCPKIMEYARLDPNGARKNPDNYAFFTLSYWFWKKRRYNANGSPEELAADGEP
ncbi:MAG: hypothetical protein Q9180_006716, partial [Flavoplaca navasiana]